MPRTYGALGPRGESQDPAFTRALLLLSKQRRAGPGPVRQPSGPIDYLTNPLAKDRYARAMLDEQIRQMVSQREGQGMGLDLAREQMLRQGALGQQQLGLQERGLGIEEESLRARIRSEALARAQQERAMAQQGEFGRGGLDLGRAELAERTRAAQASEALRGREIGAKESGTGSPLEEAQMQAVKGEVAANMENALSRWMGSDTVNKRLLSFVRKGDIKGAVDFIFSAGPVPKTAESLDVVRRVFQNFLLQNRRESLPDSARTSAKLAGLNFLPDWMLDPAARSVRRAGEGVESGYQRMNEQSLRDLIDRYADAR